MKFFLLSPSGNLYTNLLPSEYNFPYKSSSSSIHSGSDSTPYPILKMNLVGESPLLIIAILSGILNIRPTCKEFSLTTCILLFPNFTIILGFSTELNNENE